MDLQIVPRVVHSSIEYSYPAKRLAQNLFDMVQECTTPIPLDASIGTFRGSVMSLVAGYEQNRRAMLDTDNPAEILYSYASMLGAYAGMAMFSLEDYAFSEDMEAMRDIASTAISPAETIYERLTGKDAADVDVRRFAHMLGEHARQIAAGKQHRYSMLIEVESDGGNEPHVDPQDDARQTIADLQAILDQTMTVETLIEDAYREMSYARSHAEAFVRRGAHELSHIDSVYIRNACLGEGAVPRLVRYRNTVLLSDMMNRLYPRLDIRNLRPNVLNEAMLREELETVCSGYKAAREELSALLQQPTYEIAAQSFAVAYCLAPKRSGKRWNSEESAQLQQIDAFKTTIVTALCPDAGIRTKQLVAHPERLLRELWPMEYELANNASAQPYSGVQAEAERQEENVTPDEQRAYEENVTPAEQVVGEPKDTSSWLHPLGEYEVRGREVTMLANADGQIFWSYCTENQHCTPIRMIGHGQMRAPATLAQLGVAAIGKFLDIPREKASEVKASWEAKLASGPV